MKHLHLNFETSVHKPCLHSVFSDFVKTINAQLIFLLLFKPIINIVYIVNSIITLLAKKCI